MVTSADLSSQFALDVQAVNGLRIEAKKTSQAGLEAAAKQFEALFMNMMLKSMREATSQDSLLDSDQSRLYISMLDQQLSQNMASRGIGMADVMVRQLSHGLSAELPQDADALPSAPVSGQPLPPASPQSSAPMYPMRQQMQASPSLPPQSPQVAAFQSGMQAQVAEFQAKLMPHAREASQATGIPARFMLGQAALESGWGKREIRAADGTPSHNLFGVKAGSNWKGPVVEIVTTEYVNGVAQKSIEKFRAYDSYADAFRDYANLLRGNPRYAGVMAQVAQGLDAEGFANGLQQAGYATDPNYADKLSRIIKTTPWS
ncbi:MAG: flagellar assembly peptidoglycan hydrolase FlgJ [Nitrosospira sp.]